MSDLVMVYNANYQHYFTAGTATKVTMVIGNHGSFSALYNAIEKKTKISRNYKDFPFYNRLFAKGERYFDNRTDIAKVFGNMEDWKKEGLQKCVCELRRAWQIFLAGDKFRTDCVPLTLDEQNLVFAKIRDVEQKFMMMLQANQANTPANGGEGDANSTATTASGTEFAKVSVSTLSEGEINFIQSLINEKASVDGVSGVYNGKEYKLKQTETAIELYCRDAVYTVADADNGGEGDADTASVQADERATETMAVVDNDDGLTEFVKGEFYKVDGSSQTFGGNTYHCLVNANGEKRFVSANRVRLVQVYQDAPKSGVESEKAMA